MIAGLFVQGRPRKHHQIRILKFHSKTSVINDPPFIASATGTFLRLHQRVCLCLCLYLLVLLSSSQLQLLPVWNDDACQTIKHKNFALRCRGGEYYVRVQHESVFASRAAVDKYSCDLNTYAEIQQRFWKLSMSLLIFHLSFIPLYLNTTYSS